MQQPLDLPQALAVSYTLLKLTDSKYWKILKLTGNKY